MSLDLVIHNGVVVDGSGTPRFRADVAIDSGRIIHVGKVDAEARRRIDAEAMLVVPGFIDGHTHLDAQVNWDPFGPSAWHGVTTAVMGNCSFALAPCRESAKDLVLTSFERAEDMSRAALLAGIDWRWEHFAEYLDHLRRLPKGINYAAQVGHSALRAHVMGERCFTDEATDEEIAMMQRELRDSLDAGAIGFSSDRSRVHFTSDDRPVPARQSSWTELGALLDVLTDSGRGVFQLNIQDVPLDEAEAARECASRMTLAEWALSGGRPMLSGGASTPGLTEAFAQANARGGRVFGHWNAKEFDSVTGFRVRLAFDTLPGWKLMRSLSLDEQRRTLMDEAHRRDLVHEALTNRSGSEISAEARHPEYERMEVMGPGVGPFKTVADVAAERGVTPVDAIIDLSLETDFHQLFSQSIQTHHPTRQEYIDWANDPHKVWGVSDAGAHLAQSVAYDNTTYFLAHWVRDEGCFTWEAGIRKLTSDPAFVWGFADRGLIRPGYAADVLVIDPESLSLEGPFVANDLPGGATRLVQRGVGYRHVVVNGVETMHDNQPTGDHAGAVLSGCGGANAVG